MGHGIPPLPPLPLLPWRCPGPTAARSALSFALVRELLPAAFAIAMLGAIESLLSAVVADGMTGRKHDPDAELMAQGIGNLVAPFFGGFAATGAIARTATNIRSGARSPIAALVHALVVLAGRAAARRRCSATCRWPRSRRCCCSSPGTWPSSTTSRTCCGWRRARDVVVLLTCFFLTVLFDMVVAVSVGVVLAALLFMRRMAEVSEVRLVDAHPMGLDAPAAQGRHRLRDRGAALLRRGAEGDGRAADASTRACASWSSTCARVPVLDATGLVGLESAFERLHRAGVLVVIGGAQPQPLRAMARAGWARPQGPHRGLRLLRPRGRRSPQGVRIKARRSAATAARGTSSVRLRFRFQPS